MTGERLRVRGKTLPSQIKHWSILERVFLPHTFAKAKYFRTFYLNVNSISLRVKLRPPANEGEETTLLLQSFYCSIEKLTSQIEESINYDYFGRNTKDGKDLPGG